MTTGEKIRDLRKRQGLSQEQLANLAGLSRQAVSRWEAEDAVPETAMIIQLSEIFQVTTDYLLKDTESGAGANAGSSDATGGHAHNRGNRRLWVGLACVAFTVVILLILFFMGLANPILRVGTFGEIVNVWDWGFWTSNEMVPLAGVLLVVFVAGLYQLGKYYFCDWQPKA